VIFSGVNKFECLYSNVVQLPSLLFAMSAAAARWKESSHAAYSEFIFLAMLYLYAAVC
jgi:hypothetical protein